MSFCRACFRMFPYICKEQITSVTTILDYTTNKNKIQTVTVKRIKRTENVFQTVRDQQRNAAGNQKRHKQQQARQKADVQAQGIAEIKAGCDQTAQKRRRYSAGNH